MPDIVPGPMPSCRGISTWSERSVGFAALLHCSQLIPLLSLIIECHSRRALAQMDQIFHGPLHWLGEVSTHRERSGENTWIMQAESGQVTAAPCNGNPSPRADDAGVSRTAPDQEVTEDDKMKERGRKKAAATGLAISLMGHRGVKRWLAAGNCGPPEPLIRAAVLCAAASDSQ